VLKQSFLGRGEIPACRDCTGLVKTATVSFGQAMPREAMARAEAETLASDLFVVLGSSLSVYPAAGFPVVAKRNGARLAIVNREPTDQDGAADVVIHEGIGAVMSAVAAAIEPARLSR
jgi:NAD-dependent deacetylase